jgi:hypothetical protein
LHFVSVITYLKGNLMECVPVNREAKKSALLCPSLYSETEPSVTAAVNY